MHQVARDVDLAADTADERLAGELDRLGIRVLLGRQASDAGEPLRPVDLLAGLVASGEARLQTATIPLLLWRPDYASAAQAAAVRLPEQPRRMLQCFHTAAMLLSRRLRDRLEALRRPSAELPDLFSIELGLADVGTPEQRLADLAARQAELSGEALNWLGTYEHMATEQLRLAQIELLEGDVGAEVLPEAEAGGSLSETGLEVARR